MLQVWLTMYNILCDGECRRRYHFNQFRKGQVLRVRRFLNDVLLDQLPVLSEVQRYMDELAIMNAPEPTKVASALILEQVPEMRTALTREKWDDVAKEALAGAFSVVDSASDFGSLAQVSSPSPSQLSAPIITGAITGYASHTDCRCPSLPLQMYTMDGFSEEEAAKCANCGKDAVKRCSRCHSEWYCGRECQVSTPTPSSPSSALRLVCPSTDPSPFTCRQVSAWKGHKAICDVLVTAPKPEPTQSS